MWWKKLCVCIGLARGFFVVPARNFQRRMMRWSAGDAADSLVSAKGALRDAAKRANRGFAATAGENNDVKAAINDLVDMGNLTWSREGASLDGNWTLLWTDAPDILNLGSPLAKVGRIGQDIHDDVIENVIQYLPPDWALDRFPNDLVEQRVVLNYVRSGNTVDLSVKGLRLRPKTIFGFDIPENLALDAVGSSSGGPTLPFGRFTILYNDGDLRIVKTAQGFFAVNERMIPTI